MRLRFKNRKPPPLLRAASADAANGRAYEFQADEKSTGGGGDNTISSPSTPNSSISSHSNHGLGTPSPNTPSPATPTQQPGTPLGTPNTPSTPGSISSHKNSLKGTKLARRARSFKDDLFEKISQMRTPTNTLGRSHSPNSPRSKHAAKGPATAEEMAKSTQSLEAHVKELSNALKHLRDVILKNKLEVLPGNSNIILETVGSMFAVIQSYTLNENSTLLFSASQQVYQSLGKLLKLCDLMLTDEKEEYASLSQENVKEAVDLLEMAVRNLFAVAQEKLKEKEENTFKYGSESSPVPSHHNHLIRPAVEVAGQRTSLPDITLTPNFREFDIADKKNSSNMRPSQSTESIIRGSSPPPKPPLPNRSTDPPPLPPKRRSQQSQSQLQQQSNHQHQPLQQNKNHHSNNISLNSFLLNSAEFASMNDGSDHLFVRTHSPDENSSQCSLDSSSLNHSRDEYVGEDLKQDNDLEKYIISKQANAVSVKNNQEDKVDGGVCSASPASVMSMAGLQNMGTITTMASATALTAAAVAKSNNKDADSSGGGGGDGGGGGGGVGGVASSDNNNDKGKELGCTEGENSNGDGEGNGNGNVEADDAVDRPEMRNQLMNNRHSNESGFISMKSFRTSGQSVSKRSSDYSFQSSAKSSNSEIALDGVDATATSNVSTNHIYSHSSGELQHHHQQLQQLQQQHQQYHHHQQSTTMSNYASLSATSTSAIASLCNSSISSHTTTTAMEQLQSFKTFSTSSTTSSMKMSMSTSMGGVGGGGGGDGSVVSDDNHLISSSSSIASPEPYEIEQLHAQHMQSLSSLTKTSSLDTSSSDDILSHIIPPALPPKTSRSKERTLSQFTSSFEKVDHSIRTSDFPELRPHHERFEHRFMHLQSKHQSLIEPRPRAGGISSSCNALGEEGNAEKPPPLPSKKHIWAYMEICAAPSRNLEQNRHTVHAYNLNRNSLTHSHTMNITPIAKELSTSPEHETPPALPPKNYNQRKPSAVPPTIITTPPPSPKPSHLNADVHNAGSRVVGGVGGVGGGHGRVLSGTQASEMMSTVCEENFDLNDDDQQVAVNHSHNLPNVGRSRPGSRGGERDSATPMRSPICTPEFTSNGEEDDEGIDVVTLEKHGFNNEKHCATINSLPKDNLLHLTEVSKYLIMKKEGEDGPDVKGGYIDALIVHASRVDKTGYNAFVDAFITTFRTFIEPVDVIEKLTHRYTYFFCQADEQKKVANETISLLMRVVNDLTYMDISNQLFNLVVEFFYQLVCSGQLSHAKALRNIFFKKVEAYKEQKGPVYIREMHCTVTNVPSLLDLKSSEIAEQMTLLDAELFQKIEIPEVLLFAKEQCEEKSPNLNKFTEHFNKMSYWARSKILMLSDAKEREKYVIKFIKIMKHLRKMNNYNSYLALLSALDSAPIRRLEWHKTITEGLKEYCTLIDSSSSFRVYRQALAETNPPCIPYIGLVLQDLTFVHVGNPDYLKEAVINFSKRWQQFNIIENMKRFKKCSYDFRRNDRIIQFFENFENFLGEEEMWQISETIKPRVKRPPLHN